MKVSEFRRKTMRKSMKIGDKCSPGGGELSISTREQRTEAGRWGDRGGGFIEIDENRRHVVPQGEDYPFQPANSGPKRGGRRGFDENRETIGEIRC